MKDSSLTPRIAETAKGLWMVYLVLTLACWWSLHLVGMETWDALMHAFSVMGLGGFSTRDASLGHFNSIEVESVVMFFALLSGINYSTHFMALFQRDLKAYANDRELPFYFGVLTVSILALSVHLMPYNVSRRLLEHAALRRFPLDLAGHLAGFRHRRLHLLADVRAGVDPVPGQLHRLLRFDRRRHQADARDHPLQTGVS